MAQIIDIRRVEVGPRSLTARVRIATNAPLYTSEDLQGTARVYRLMPHIIEHTCLGDSSETFKDVMGDTEIAHLLEHVTVELLAQSDIAGDISSGRTFAVEDERRTYDVEIACPDDVLVAGALSSAVWILQWAYTDGSDPEPDVEATVKGLVGLVQNLPEPEENAPSVIEYVVSGEEAEALIAEHEIFSNDVPGAEPEAIDGLDEPEGADAGPVTVDGVKESPEARQASQDVPAPRVDPEIVPEVPVHDPVPDPFPMPTFEEEIILDAAYETVEEDTMGSTMVSGRIISESEVDEIMASFARANAKEESEPEVEPEPVADEEYATVPESDTTTEPVPIAVTKSESEQEPDRVAEAEDLGADAERESEDVAEAEDEPEAEAAVEPEPESEEAVEPEPVAEDEPEAEAAVEPEATADVEPEPVEETAEEEPVADEVVAPAPEREFVDDEIVLVPFEEPEDRVEAEPVSENVEPEPAPEPEPQPEPEPEPEQESASEPAPLEDEQFDDEADETASFKPIAVEEQEVLEPVIDNAEFESAAEPELENSNVVDVVEENDVFEPAGEDEGDAELAFTLPKGISWSTAASATGEWGTIPEPKFVR